MSNRITSAQLEKVCELVNRATKSPLTYSVGGTIAVGHFMIDSANGGYSLERVMSTSGGTNDVLNTGHIPAKELYNLIHAFSKGLIFNI